MNKIMRRFLGINIGSHEEKFNSIEFIDLFALILILFVIKNSQIILKTLSNNL